MTAFVRCLIFGLLSVNAPAFAHQPIVDIQFEKTNGYVLHADEFQAIIQQSQGVIEGDETGSFANRWVQAFNFKSKLIDGMRWADSNKSSQYRDMIINSLFLFGLSHSTEMLSGPILLGIAHVEHWPLWVKTMIGSGGTMISVPGLDPLCFLVFQIFRKSESFRNGVGYLRLATVHGYDATLGKTKLAELARSMLARGDVREYLENLDGLKSIEEDDDGTVALHYEIDLLQLTVRLKDGVAYLDSVTSPYGSEIPKSQWPRRLMSQFGWNAKDFMQYTLRNASPYVRSKPYWNLRDFINEALRSPNVPVHKPYIESAIVDGDRVTYHLRDFAIRVNAPRVGWNCDSVLAGVTDGT